MAVDGGDSFTGFVENMVDANIGARRVANMRLISSALFMFILFSNILGLLPFGVDRHVHPFTVTSHFTITGESWRS